VTTVYVLYVLCLCVECIVLCASWSLCARAQPGVYCLCACTNSVLGLRVHCSHVLARTNAMWMAPCAAPVGTQPHSRFNHTTPPPHTPTSFTISSTQARTQYIPSYRPTTCAAFNTSQQHLKSDSLSIASGWFACRLVVRCHSIALGTNPL
jgi:hypothetical protein